MNATGRRRGASAPPWTPVYRPKRTVQLSSHTITSQIHVHSQSKKTDVYGTQSHPSYCTIFRWHFFSK